MITNDFEKLSLKKFKIGSILPDATVLCLGKRRCLGKGTRVLMYDGSICNIENIKFGDLVMGDDSTPRKVLEIHNGIDELYKIVHHTTGESYIVNKEHILSLMCISNSNIIDLSIQDYLRLPDKTQKQMHGYTNPIEFVTKKLDILPYTFGQLLINKKIESIPFIYKTSSILQRKEIIAGIIDNCGGFSNDGKLYIRISKNDSLVDSIMFILKSIGISIGVVQDKYHTIIYMNGGVIDQIPTKVIIKSLFPYPEKLEKNISHSELSVIPKGQGEFYGIELDGNQRYVLSNFIVTHNSGKCLGKGTQVIMSDGKLRKVDTIETGDYVMGDDSKKRKVLSTHNGEDNLYTIVPSYGNKLHIKYSNYTVNSEHILSLKWYKSKSIIHNKTKRRFSVEWFDQQSIKTCKKTFSYKMIDYETILTKAHEFYNSIVETLYVDIPVKEYVKLEKYYKSRLMGYRVGVEFEYRDFKNNISPYDLGVKLAKHTGKNGIPYEYKCSHRNQRLEILSGMLETSGRLDKHGNYILRTHKDPQLTDDIIYLVQSLGLDITFKYKRSTTVFIINPKIDILTDTKRENLYKIKVIQNGLGEYYGFELDGNNRYLLGNFVVTHNSWLVRDIFYHHRHIPSGVVFSGTEEASPFFSDFIPDCFIHSEYDPELMESIMNRQKKKIRESKMSGKSDTGKLTSNNVFIVLDDMLHDAQNWKKEKTIKSIFFNGRHFNFLFILTMQYPLGITPELRSNIDYVFIFNEPSVKNRKKIYDDYAGMIPSFDHFCNILDACTQNHECLVIKTSGNSTDIRDQIFWYKAEAHNNFRVGHPKFWKYHDLRYNTHYEDQEDKDQEELDKLKKKFAKTRKLKVIVSRQGDIVGYKED